MLLDRSELKRSEHKIKNAEEFVENAEKKRVGRPNSKKELTKPVSLSLTETEQRKLDNIPKRFNLLAYQYDQNTDLNLNRSDIVKLMSKYLTELDDDSFYELLSKLL
ncbi:hypothetical protein [Aliivibrio fischeri]|uniref:hypothetical protein n=1 Tax=Aliivibrio fischeri TaxID=668 RepID=UPI0007C5B7C4|nr:hypothetical protein [Aliivibrio fischeri]MBP3155197.1 hypothetical protein [Aliivibrio fischeri]MCE7575817.1 hypothetical protein [Aliivibrio fischeri]MUK41519.1 hypothetical protein [Aliivibrio fischeri]